MCSSRRCSCMSNDFRFTKFCNCGADGVVCSRPPDGDDDNDGDGHYDDQDLWTFSTTWCKNKL